MQHNDSRAGSGGGRLKVFVASPGDVESERKTAFSILETLQLIHKLDLYRWEDTIPGFGAPVQQQIANQIPIANCHIFVAILWSRLGTPTGMKRADGTEYLSGTQYEIEQAIEAHERNRNGLPKIMIYRKMDDPTAQLKDKSDAIIQYGKLLEYLKLFEPGGRYPAWIYPFQGHQFEGTFRKHIVRVLQEATASPATGSAAAQPAAPPAGAQVTEAEHLTLTPAQIEEGKRALLAAFDRSGLEQLVYFALGERYEKIIPRGSLDSEVFHLLEWAMLHHQVIALFRAARQANPSNPTLRQFAAQLGLA